MAERAPSIGRAEADWEVERTGPSDAAEIAALGADAFARGWSEASIAAELARPDAEIWILRRERAPCGFLIARRIPTNPAGSKPDEPAGSKPDEPAGSKPDEPAGSKSGEPAGSAWLEVLLVAVRADARGRGGGSALVSAALEAARRAGLRGVQLEVRASNRAAIGLYRRHGFTEVGRRPRYYEGREDAVLMDLALPGSADV